MMRRLLPVLLCLLPLPAAAQDRAPDPATIPTLAKFRQAGADLVWLGRKLGMDGWLVRDAHELKTVYTTPDGQGVVLGLLFDEAGKAQTQRQLIEAFDQGLITRDTLTAAGRWASLGKDDLSSAAAATPDGQLAQPGLSPGDRLLAALDGTSYLTLGNGPVVVYSFVDPTCPHCKKFWAQIAPEVAAGHIQARLIPIYNKDGNRELAAALLAAPDPLKSWTELVTQGPASLTQPSTPSTLRAVDENLALHRKWQLPGTPYSVYRAQGGKVRIIAGELNDTAPFLADIGAR